jgi:calcium-dependent protein kinase
MERFVGMAKLKRLALNVLSRELTGKELKALKDVFLSIDVDRSGKISTKELQAALQPHLGAENATAGDLLKAVDVSGDDEIDYNEFLAATMQRALYKQEENIRRVFQRLDVDGSGEITVANLVEITGSKKHAMELLNEADLNADQVISYAEFKALMEAK